MTIKGLVGVAISTTGDKHRLPLLGRCVAAWREVIPLGSVIVVTVDGTDADALAAMAAVDASAGMHCGGITLRVGQGRVSRNSRQGVAVNKNTGIEYLMNAGCEHLFLSDDDIWPRNSTALALHTSGPGHSMVNWGWHRYTGSDRGLSFWKWPRGAMLYAHREVVEQVGGMVEEFGVGGHEHVEWSRRINAAGLTPFKFGSPAQYAGSRGMGAHAFWHAEDMARPGESLSALRRRRDLLTSIRRTNEDWAHIESLMKVREHSTEFVPFTAETNGRLPATMSSHSAQAPVNN